MTVADLIVDALRSGGVRTLFGVPGGGGNLDLIAAAGRRELPFVLTATESAAAIAALAQAEITGGAGACLTTLGPGAASAVNGVACAWLERVPLVIFTDTQAASTPGFEHQRLDHAALFASITKSSASLCAESAAAVVAAALHSASSGRPGPVHLDCPGDVAAAEAPPGGAHRTPPAESTLSADQQRHLSVLLDGARKPLLIVGLGARQPADADAIRRFLDRRQLPAMVTYKAKGVVPDAHPWFAGVFTNAAIEQSIVAESDLLIAIGVDPVELIPRPWRNQQPVLYCGRWRVDEGHVPFATQILGDIPQTLSHVAQAPAAAWNQRSVQDRVAAQRNAVSVDTAGLGAHQVVTAAAGRLASVARVTVDAGAHMFPATMLWPVSEPNGMLISNGLSTMGFALPAAIGAATLDRGRPVVALTGDGGLLMCAGELLTAVRERLRIITIVFNDASLSLIEIKQQARRLPPAGVALGVLDWCALARSTGMPAWPAHDAASLDSALEQALAADGPCLIEAKIDRSNYGATLRAIRG